MPLIFDYLHHEIHDLGLSIENGLNLALSTWGGVKPLCHYSESRIKEDKTVKKQAHSDWIYNKIETFQQEFDIDIEAKMKEQTLLKYRNLYE